MSGTRYLCDSVGISQDPRRHFLKLALVSDTLKFPPPAPLKAYSFAPARREIRGSLMELLINLACLYFNR